MHIEFDSEDWACVVVGNKPIAFFRDRGDAEKFITIVNSNVMLIMLRSKGLGKVKQINLGVHDSRTKLKIAICSTKTQAKAFCRFINSMMPTDFIFAPYYFDSTNA